MRLITLFPLFVLAGCTVGLGQQRLHEAAVALHAADAVTVQRAAAWRLPAATGLYVAVADDLPVAAGDAGLLVAQRSAEALRRGFVAVHAGQRPESPAAALASARRQGAVITVYPQLLGTAARQPHWRAAGSMAEPFVEPGRRLALVWVLLDTASGDVLDRVHLTQRAAWAPLAADADRLLDPALAAAAAALMVEGSAG